MRWNIGSTSFTTQDTGLPPDHPSIPFSSSSAPSSSRQPPASCPMHQSTGATTAAATSSSSPKSGAAKCPVDHANLPNLPKSTSAKPAACPVKHDTLADLDPYTHMPKNLSTERAPGQNLDLPTERTASTIPRPKFVEQEEGEGDTWDYPSPQQFYNALVRKGWETPEESIEMVVAIHNFLNERAWEEVMRWEKRLPGGDQAQLARFQGRPGELSPKARFHLWAGKLFPSKFNTEPPFDRHDWVVTRPTTAESTTTTRYVIDYYSAPPDEEGNPVFSLDVRPALDSLESINQRIKVGLEEWLRGQEQQ